MNVVQRSVQLTVRNTCGREECDDSEHYEADFETGDDSEMGRSSVVERQNKRLTSGCRRTDLVPAGKRSESGAVPGARYATKSGRRMNWGSTWLSGEILSSLPTVLSALGFLNCAPGG